jgi:hypothetical protein
MKLYQGIYSTRDPCDWPVYHTNTFPPRTSKREAEDDILKEIVKVILSFKDVDTETYYKDDIEEPFESGKPSRMKEFEMSWNDLRVNDYWDLGDKWTAYDAEKVEMEMEDKVIHEEEDR